MEIGVVDKFNERRKYFFADVKWRDKEPLDIESEIKQMDVN